jgi:peptidoglycan-associated lipoprotein
MKFIAKLVVLLLPVLLIIGCSSKGGETEESAAEESISGGQETIEAPVVEEVTPITTIEPETVVEETGDSDLLAERKVYFDFDRSEIRPEFRDLIAAHANYLAANPDVSVTIEGHCDERGTREYNMALGERRADAVRRLLTLQGASKSQISTVSYGEEQPAVEGHDESAWKWNRRAVIVYAE